MQKPTGSPPGTLSSGDWIKLRRSLFFALLSGAAAALTAILALAQHYQTDEVWWVAAAAGVAATLLPTLINLVRKLMSDTRPEWFRLLVFALCLAVPATAIADLLVISGGKHYRLKKAADGSPVLEEDPHIDGVVNLDDGTTDPTDPTVPTDPTSELTKATRQLLAEVPAHSKKAVAAKGLAAIFQVVGEQYSAGKIPQAKLFEVLDESIDQLLTSLKTADQWSGFLEGVKSEINDRQLRTPEDVEKAFSQIAEGLSGQEAIRDLIPHVVRLITAVISKDQVEIVQAVLAIISELIGG